MMWLWTGEVTADGRATACWPPGRREPSRRRSDSPGNYPAIMHLRLYGMNANGKVYELDRPAGQLNQ